MRVALVSPLFESVPPRLYGGTERVIYNLCSGLSEADIEVTLFASGDSCVPGRVIPAIDEALRLRKRAVADPIPYNFKMMKMVADRAHEFDVIHNHHDYWMLPLSEMTNTPVLTTLHGRMDLPDIHHAFLSYPRASFVSISDAQQLPMPMLPWVRTIHHGIDVEQFQFRKKPGQYLAFLGRIDADKRPDLAIAIAKQAGIPLKIAAKIEGEASRQMFETCIKPHLDGRNIEYVGEISESEKSDFLGDALALAFPIDWPEPFGLVMVESLACGTPVLARPCGSAPELLSDGITGYCHADVRELARRVRDLPALDRRKCREWVEKRFSLKRMTEDYIDVYRDLAERSGAGAGQRLHARFGRAAGHRRHQLHSV